MGVDLAELDLTAISSSSFSRLGGALPPPVLATAPFQFITYPMSPYILSPSLELLSHFHHERRLPPPRSPRP